MIDILRQVADGALTPEEAALRLRADAVERLDERAAVDTGRIARTGIPEVVLAGPKRTVDVVDIAVTLVERTGQACVSRARRRHRRALAAMAAERGLTVVDYGQTCLRLVRVPAAPPAGAPLVGLVAAGTSDLEALGEARMVCEAAGCATQTIADVGVAGLHRLLGPLATLVRADPGAIVVAAGMDGALPSVVAGLVAVPVIGLPTRTGYGEGGGGRAALLSILQACVPGLVAVNVGNGVGAGAAAALIARARAGAASPAPVSAPR